jgi:uncharacterized protein (DUF433 family)
MKNVRYISLESAARIGQVSEGQARSWARDGIVEPSVVYNRDSYRHTFIYSPDDVVALRSVGELRRRFNTPLKATRDMVRHIQARDGMPWSDLAFEIANRQIHFMEPFARSSVGRDAVIFEIEPLAADVTREIEKLSRRNPENVGKIERRRDVMGGQPVVKGTRVPVSTIVNLATAGWDVAQIVESYPALVPEDVRSVLQLVEEQRQVA